MLRFAKQRTVLVHGGVVYVEWIAGSVAFAWSGDDASPSAPVGAHLVGPGDVLFEFLEGPSFDPMRQITVWFALSPPKMSTDLWDWCNLIGRKLPVKVVV